MKISDWREAFTELAEAYYRATGELWPTPKSSISGRTYSRVIVTKAMLEDMYLVQGMRLREIAEVLGCCESSVSNMLRLAEIPARDPGDYPKTEAQIEAAAKLKRYQYQQGHAMSAETRQKISAHRFERAAENGYEFGGSEHTTPYGYVMVYAPEHPRAQKSGCVPKHTLVMERYLGRYLEDDEVVHHINKIRDDNRIENLQLMNRQEHNIMHGKENGGKRNSRK